MNPEKDESLYRPNVGLALFRDDGLVFTGQRVGIEGPYQWQMPQGGVDEGESPSAAALRELEEEIGVPPRLVTLLEESPDWLFYDFPPETRTRLGKKHPYLGQRQKWFAFRFKGRDSDIRLDAHEREFSDWRWQELSTTPSLVIPFKRATYETIAQRFKRYTL